MKEIGFKTRPMDMVNTFVLTVLVTKGTGFGINEMVKGWRNGQMVPDMTVNIKPEKRADSEKCYGVMEAHTKETS